MSQDDNAKAQTAVRGLLAKDNHSQLLGIEVEEVRLGYARCRLEIGKQFLNGFGICHGGVTLSLADTTAAFAANTHGQLAVTVDCNMSFCAPVFEGDILIATAEERKMSEKVAFYTVNVHKIRAGAKQSSPATPLADEALIGIFSATAYRSKLSA